MRHISITFIILFLSFPLVAQRDSISLDGKWNFSPDSLQLGLKNKWYITLNPKTVSQVNVPHTWNMTNGLYRYFGWAWYQRTVFIPKSFVKSDTEILFKAVYRDAKVWVNGVLVGSNKGSGFTKFSFDVSKHLKAGKLNTITVLADNSFSRQAIPFMSSFDWPNDGGIIRSSYIITRNTPNIQNLQVSQKTNFETKSAQVQATFKLSHNKIIDPKLLKIKVSLCEENQPTTNLIYNDYPKVNHTANNSIDFKLDLSSIKPWHFDYPNLYKLKVELWYNTIHTDTYYTNIGFRELKTKGHELYFNNEKIRLAGIEAMFGSSLVSGMAETKDELREYLEKLQKHNAFFTRFHWQQDDYVLDWCDRNGMLVQVEIPVWGHKTVFNDTIMSIAKQQLQNTITNQYNHPCIVAWGVGNEVDARKKINIDGVDDLYRFVKRLDESRLVNYVSNTLQQARHWMPKGTLNDASEKGDVLMYNDYHSTWYRQSMAGIGAVMDTIKIENRPMPLVISEFGLCEPENWGDDHKRITDMIYYYAVYESKPHIAGTIYFCLNDYRTHMGGGIFKNHKARFHGVYDLNGKPKKSASVLTELNSPVEMSGLNRDKDNKIEITIVASNGIPSYTLRSYKLYWSKNPDNFVVDSQSKLIPDLEPGKLFSVKLENHFANKGTITIVSPTGRIVYQKQVDNIEPYF